MGVIIRGACAATGGTALSLLAAIALAGGVQPAAGSAQPAAPQAHHEQSFDSNVRRSEAQYAIPNVNLIRDDGKSVDLAAELDDGRPVVLNFIYTSCTTTCPMSSQIFEQLQEDLGSAREAVHLVSISIDPEQDTPARLRAYGEQFHAGKSWNHYSGTMAASVAVQRAFNAYRGDKMSHVPLTLVRAAPGKPWVRFDGFARADELMAERKLWPAAPVAAPAVSLVSR